MLDEPPEAQRLQLLNDVWKVVMKLESPEVTTRLNCSCQFPGTTTVIFKVYEGGML